MCVSLGLAYVARAVSWATLNRNGDVNLLSNSRRRRLWPERFYKNSRISSGRAHVVG